jgi:hypothetical protein
MAGFFNELDSADSIKCCCDNMANNILDVAEEIEKPTKGGMGGPADQKEKRRRPGSYQEKMEERGRSSRGEKPQRIPPKTPSKIELPERISSKAPSKIELPERMPSGKGGKIGKPGIGSVIGGGCSMACDAAEKIVEASKKGISKVTEALSKGKDKIVQAGKSALNWISDGTKKIWGTVSEFGERIAQKAANLGKGVIDYVKSKFNKYSRYLIAMIKDSKIMKKVVELSVKRLGPAIERLLTKLAAAVLGISTGGVMTVVFGILAAYDMAMLAYGLYQLFFVEPPEGEGLYKEIKQMVEDWWKTLTEPSKEAPAAIPTGTPLAAPKAAAPAAPAAQTPKAKSTAPAASSAAPVAAPPAPPAAQTPKATSTAPAAPVAAPVAAPALTTASAVAPPPKMAEPQEKQSASTGAVEVQTAQVAGLGFGSPRRQTEGVIMHHTGGNSLDVAVKTLQARKLSYHYLIDRDGRVVNILPDNLVGYHAGNTDKMPKINNSNTVSISMVAKDDSDVTPQQVVSATSLESKLSQKYGFSKTNVYGHGEVASHKHPKEGYTIASAIRGGTAPSAREIKEGPGGKSLGFETPPNFQGSAEQIMKSMEATGIDKNELRDTFMQIFTENLMDTSGSTTIINNVVNVENKKGSQNKKFTDPDIAEKIFKNAFAF